MMRNDGRRWPGWHLVSVWLITRLGLAAILYAGRDDDGIMFLINHWNEAFWAEGDPYTALGTAYPPLAMYLFAGLGLVAMGTGSMQVGFAVMLLVVDLVGLLVCASAGGRRAASVWIVVPLALGPILFYWRYDALVALCSLIALFHATRGRRTPSWAWLGIGIAMKPYLLVVLPLWMLWEWGDREAGYAARAFRIGALIGPSIVAALAMTSSVGMSWWSSYGFQVNRAMTAESTPSTMLSIMSHVGLGSSAPRLDGRDCLCLVRTGEYADVLQAVFPLLLVGFLGIVYWRYWRSGSRDEELPVYAALCIVVLLLGYPVFSPQYLVWLLCLLPLVRADRLVIGGAIGAAALANASFPYLYSHIYADDALGIALLSGRVALTAVCAAGLWRLTEARKARSRVESLERSEST